VAAIAAALMVLIVWEAIRWWLYAAPGEVTDSAVLTAGLLFACGAGAAWISTRANPDEPEEAHIGLLADRSWMFAAVLLLPAPLATLTVGTLATTLTVAPRRRGGLVPSALIPVAAAVLATTASEWVLDLLAGTAAFTSDAVSVLTAVTAALTFEAVATGGAVLLRVAAGLRVPYSALPRVIWQNLSMLSYGVVIAWVALTGPWFLIFAIPPVVVLQRTLFHDDLRRRLRFDIKTGAATAAWWSEQATTSIAAATTERPTSIILIDLDHFKRINDDHGHLVGDLVLAEATTAIQSAVRDSDLVGRFGGEEFVVLLPRTNTEAAQVIAERIRRAIEATEVRPTGDVTVHVTASLGVATAPNHGHTVERVTAAADLAMYEAKANGRNLTRVAWQDDPNQHLRWSEGSTTGA
jgi:diguanylate cyclase (GGDEF)-like protein